MNKKLNIKKISIFLGIAFSFLILDVGIRYLLYKEIGFLSYKSLSPFLFSLSYVVIIYIILIIFSKKAKVIYIFLISISNIYYLSQIIHFKILGKYFSIVSLFSAGEGADYLGYVIKTIDINMMNLSIKSRQ